MVLIEGPPDVVSNEETSSIIKRPRKDYNKMMMKQRRNRKENVVWKHVASYPNESSAHEALLSYGKFTLNYKSSAMHGDRHVYNCSHFKARSQRKCPARLSLFLCPDSMKTHLESTGEHDHTGGTEADISKHAGMSNEDKDVIKQLLKDGITMPKKIIASFHSRNLAPPGLVQLNNFLSRFRQKDHGGDYTLSETEFKDWCIKHVDVPEDPIQPFVVAYESSESEQILRVLISSKVLLADAMSSQLLCGDFTYKINLHRRPIVVLATVDKNRVTHVLGIGVCSGETAIDWGWAFNALSKGINKVTGADYQPKNLMTDGDIAATNAFTATFNHLEIRLMCYFHFTEKLKPKALSLPVHLRNLILNDIDFLRLSPNSENYKVAIDLFWSHWETKPEARELLQYFKSTWLKKNLTWHEGTGHLPSTNNGVESISSTLKSQYSFRNKLPMIQALDILSQAVKDWGAEKHGKAVVKLFALKPSITTKVWIDSRQWARGNSPAFTDPDDLNQVYAKSSETAPDELSPTEALKTFMDLKGGLNCTEWNQYKLWSKQFWIIKVEEPWDKTNCSCPVYLKQYVCKHSVGICIRRDLCTPPR